MHVNRGSTCLSIFTLFAIMGIHDRNLTDLCFFIYSYSYPSFWPDTPGILRTAPLEEKNSATRRVRRGDTRRHRSSIFVSSASLFCYLCHPRQRSRPARARRPNLIPRYLGVFERRRRPMTARKQHWNREPRSREPVCARKTILRSRWSIRYEGDPRASERRLKGDG